MGSALRHASSGVLGVEMYAWLHEISSRIAAWLSLIHASFCCEIISVKHYKRDYHVKGWMEVRGKPFDAFVAVKIMQFVVICRMTVH